MKPVSNAMVLNGKCLACHSEHGKKTEEENEEKTHPKEVAENMEVIEDYGIESKDEERSESPEEV